MLKKIADTTHTDAFDVFRIQIRNQNYKILVTKIKCNKKYRIYCKRNQITGEKLIPLGRSPISVIEFVYQTSTVIESDTICLVVISGKPSIICGLDEGIFSSIRTLDINTEKNKLYVMSECAFKKFFLPLLRDYT